MFPNVSFIVGCRFWSNAMDSLKEQLAAAMMP